MLILLAENDAPLARVIAQAFESEDHVTEIVASGEKALQCLAQSKYHLLILELNLPGISGSELLPKVRRCDPDLPILILTSTDEVAERVACLDAGADDYLTKPFSFSELSARARAILRRKNSPRQAEDSLVTLFRFPPGIRSCCSQYLLYFVQFLEDLGIKADSEIKEDAGRILFSVTPADGTSALGKIKEALEVYLDLPRNPEFNATADEFSDIAVSQLKANVFFLKSQLELAQAMLETKSATIEALNLTVYQHRQLLTGPSADQTTPKAKTSSESEPIIGDTVHLTKYEGKFVKVDLPTILRRLKRSFGIGEKEDQPEP
jgi:CheY-like chemotaxis protein